MASIRLKNGNASSTAITVITMENATTNRDSPRCCVINCERFAPITLRSAISLARWPARAVDRFTKLIVATITMSRAITEKAITISISPPVLRLPAAFDRR